MAISARRARFIRAVITDARAHRWNGPGPMVGSVYALDSEYRRVYSRVAKPPTAPSTPSPTRSRRS